MINNLIIIITVYSQYSVLSNGWYLKYSVWQNGAGETFLGLKTLWVLSCGEPDWSKYSTLRDTFGRWPHIRGYLLRKYQKQQSTTFTFIPVKHTVAFTKNSHRYKCSWGGAEKVLQTCWRSSLPFSYSLVLTSFFSCSFHSLNKSLSAGLSCHWPLAVRYHLCCLILEWDLQLLNRVLCSWWKMFVMTVLHTSHVNDILGQIAVYNETWTWNRTAAFSCAFL